MIGAICVARRLMDLTGDRYGQLTVLREGDKIPEGKNMVRAWVAVCDCGKQIVVKQSYLTKGYTKDCGCVVEQKSDLTGKKFGMLTVLGISGYKKASKKSDRNISMWLCVCSCGNESVVRRSGLVSGNTKSCGCLKKNRINIEGKRFGRLVALCDAEDSFMTGGYRPDGTPRKGEPIRMVKCLCDCGKEVVTAYSSLSIGKTKSCGCYQRDRASETSVMYSTTHGMANHPLYSTWKDMQYRCYNESLGSYKDYGGRGISVCDEWLDDPNEFINWAESKGGWFEGCELSIDRIDVNGNYEPSNCRFTDATTQSLNQRIMKTNTSGFRGVKSQGDKWIATLTYKGNHYGLGSYEEVELAAEARQLKELELFGELLPETEIATDKVRLELEKIKKEGV